MALNKNEKNEIIKEYKRHGKIQGHLKSKLQSFPNGLPS